MYKKSYGDPVMTVRLPAWQIAGLKIVAREENTTSSELIRSYVAALLRDHGITGAETQPVEGQCTLNV